MTKGVAVMRRRSDSWLNATQILKVAGFDKPQRTRILEREVQKGEHEKVQGGYGKYQGAFPLPQVCIVCDVIRNPPAGTWIPIERGLELARTYNCEAAIRPIVDFQPEANSPPLAPKHLVTTGGSKPSSRRGGDGGGSTISTRSSRKRELDVEGSEMETLSVRLSEDGTMTPSPSHSSVSRTPSPLGSPGPSGMQTNGVEDEYASPGPENPRKRKHRGHHQEEEEGGARGNGEHDPSIYGDQILEYFISDTNQIPEILVNPPEDFNADMAIDDDGHTALHWAAAMGRIRIVKLLISAGADIFKVNKAGQTALMRSVMFANNYDVRKFGELYELLHRSTLNIDNSNRTIFHHIVDLAMTKGKTHASRYYMETVLTRLSEYPKELADIINFQDEEGETALTLAARCRSKRLVRVLIDHGADPKVANRDGKNAEDYIIEDEKFRHSPVLASRPLGMPFRNQTSGPPYYSFGLANVDRAPLHHSTTGQRAATRCVTDVAMMLESLATAFDVELREKERDFNQANALLTNIQAEILESQRAVSQLKLQAQGLPQAKQQLAAVEEELRTKMGKRYRLGWEKWSKDEEEREKAVRDAHGGGLPAEHDVADLLALHSSVPTDPEVVRAECERLREEMAVHKKRRKDKFEELVKFQAEAGTAGHMAEYRRLIGAGCGGVPPGEVDNVLGMLLEVGCDRAVFTFGALIALFPQTLEAEEPSSSSAAWSGSGRPPAPS